MTPAKWTILLQKVGAAAMMNEPPIPVPDLDDLMENVSPKEWTTYVERQEDDDTIVINRCSLERGLVELSVRYFQPEYDEALTSEMVNLFHGFPRKRSTPVPERNKNQIRADTELNTIQPAVVTDSIESHPEMQPRVPTAVSEELQLPLMEPADDWLHRRDPVYDAADELRQRASNGAPTVDSIHLQPQIDLVDPDELHPHIDLTERELSMQRLLLEEAHPIPDSIYMEQGFGGIPELPLDSMVVSVQVHDEPLNLNVSPVVPIQVHDEPLNLNLSPDQCLMPPPTDVPKRRRRIRRIPDLDPNYRPPKTIVRPPPLSATKSILASETIEQIREEIQTTDAALLPDLLHRDGDATISQEAIDTFREQPLEHVEVEPFMMELDTILPTPIAVEDSMELPPATESASLVPPTSFSLSVPNMMSLSAEDSSRLQVPRLSIPNSSLLSNQVLSSQSTPIAGHHTLMEFAPGLSPMRTSTPAPVIPVGDRSSMPELEPEAVESMIEPLVVARSLPFAGPSNQPSPPHAGLRSMRSRRASSIFTDPILTPILEISDTSFRDPNAETPSRVHIEKHSGPPFPRTPQGPPRFSKPIEFIPANMLTKPSHSIADTNAHMRKVFTETGKRLIDPMTSLRADDLLQADSAATFLVLCDLNNKQYLRMNSVQGDGGRVFKSVVIGETDSE